MNYHVFGNSVDAIPESLALSVRSHVHPIVGRTQTESHAEDAVIAISQGARNVFPGKSGGAGD